MKAGYKTSEFWLSSVATIVGLLLASGAMDSLAQTHWAVKVTALVASILGAMGYAVNRTRTKTADAAKETAKALSNGSNT